ncbi:MAG: N-carbamoyl-L-amino-acid hydrolase [Candidatus Aldehydirespiratoraceae bacterium]|jgi:N-carbamoyl-L-amino-acid hydrolase
MAETSNVEIDSDRLLDSLRTLRGFGSVGPGVVRPTFSLADMAARTWIRDQMEAAGLDATVDGVGNVFGRSRNDGPALIVGSHSDTQPEGGWLDGALGVMYAIEIARTLAENPTTAHLAVDAVAWADEEGTYANFLGSRSFVGELPSGFLSETNAEGESVATAIERVGLTQSPLARFEPGRHVGYVEAHIEQGPRLEDGHQRLGIVTSIVGMRAMEITFLGEQNHAGTTPMGRRKDAGVALFEYCVELRGRFEGLAGSATVWTIGNARLEPGADSIVPGSAWCRLQFRDPEDHLLDELEAAVHGLATEMTTKGPVQVSAERQRDGVSPVEMDLALRGHLAAAADVRVPDEWIDMPSAAAHDSIVMTGHLPCAMLFIPSIGGISHDFAENSTDDDITTGCRVLADAVVSRLRQAESSSI